MSETAFAVIAAEKKLAAAHVTLDLSIIDELLHDDYLILQPNGLTESKADVLASYASGERRWDAAEVSDMTVSVFGNMARVVGTWRARGENRGQAFDYQARFVSVWVDEGQGWKNITYNSAEIS